MSGPSASGGVRLSKDQLIAWLRLIRSDNVGPSTFRGLVNHYGSAQAALEALPDLAGRTGAKRVRIPSVSEAEAELAALTRAGAVLVASGETDYPARLKEIPSAPPLITVRGDPAALNRPTVAIVGSRNASIAGLKITERIARGLGEAGYVVVSGLARGIDAVAHKTALDTGTAAVVAGGVDHVYPEEHRGLTEAIVERGGAVMTEMPFGWVPRAQDFPGATGWSRGSASASSSWRPPPAPGRCTPPASPWNRTGTCWPCRARRSIRGRTAPIS